ncbi:MAG: TlpA family protein disulfide reductase [Planctomycetota bacterium]|jgi:thiol-disulfide isomerase/thioredoxin
MAKTHLITFVFCLISAHVFPVQSKLSSEANKELQELIKQIQSITDSIPEKPGPSGTDEDFDNWRKQDYNARQSRIEVIEKLESMNLSDGQLKPYYVMKLDDIESCFYYARSEANKYEAKLYTMMENSDPTGKMLANELFWRFNLYHINTHLMHISETDLQQIADLELSRKDTPEAGRLLAQAIKMANPDYDAKIRWSTWITDNMPPESEGYQLITALSRRKTDIGKKIAFEGIDLNGKKITENDFANKVLLIDYWALWCGICLQEIPDIKKMQDKYYDRGLRVLGVFNDHRIDELKKYLEEKEMSWPQLITVEATKNNFIHPLTKQYGISGFPTYLLIDREGKLVRFAGRVEHLKSDIEKLISQNKD